MASPVAQTKHLGYQTPENYNTSPSSTLTPLLTQYISSFWNIQPYSAHLFPPSLPLQCRTLSYRAWWQQGYPYWSISPHSHPTPQPFLSQPLKWSIKAESDHTRFCLQSPKQLPLYSEYILALNLGPKALYCLPLSGYLTSSFTILPSFILCSINIFMFLHGQDFWAKTIYLS